MTTNKLPQVDEAAPRRRSVAAKPAAEKKAKPTAPRKKAAPADHAPTPAQTDIVLRDQAERARLAREAALQAATPATFSPEHIGAVELAPGMYETAPAAPAPAPAPAPAAPAPLDTAQLIVNQELVDVLKAVKGTSLGDFEKFLHELYPLMELWSGALTEGAARRHALSIMLLIKERF